MPIFDLHSRVLQDYQEYIQSYFTIADDRVRAYVNQALVDDMRLWPDFLLQLSPCYTRASDVDTLVHKGLSNQKTAENKWTYH